MNSLPQKITAAQSAHGIAPEAREYPFVSIADALKTHSALGDKPFLIYYNDTNTRSEMSYSDFALQNTKMLFGRHCFCRGQAGYFKVNQGTLTMERKKGSSSIDLDFKIAEVPQLFTKVKATIK